ncbi:CoA transferase [Knoellia sp. DB2414S]|jgi:crotonobetainyl-CoA:carnitine CoA-transferase CaiB-like acyl-CoA transferase|uniref:CoA transferase n=1 Tax=Knoellia koreensis TaxID=2730921 RepID=A0A849HKJ3_9MICO|nr:CoA transferase [Knoellia sp. DB2414S]NNM47064.1 CoA transferase [Knoellia sp. DB2414S]
MAKELHVSRTTDATALAGVSVVSLAVNLPGPLAAARLASMGASVTKVEPPSGDPLQTVAPGWYDELVAGQEVVTLDLKDPAGRTALEDRLVDADVLLTAMRPSALARLGLVESIERHGLVLVEVVGYDGERSDEAGHDLTYQAAQGTLLPPTMPLVPLVDVLGAERAVSAALAGLRRRASVKTDVRERVVLDDVAFHASAAVRHGLTGPGDVLGGGLPTYGIYATADGHVAVGAIEPHFAGRLADAVGRTREELAARFGTESSAHWESLGRSLDIPLVAVHDPRAAVAGLTPVPSHTLA